MSRIISASYKVRSGFTPTITYVLRDDKIKRLHEIESDIYPYFYVRKTDFEQVKDICQQKLPLFGDGIISVQPEKDTRLYDTTELAIRISITDPRNVAKIREMLKDRGIKLYESDIPFVRRVAYDKGIYSFVEITNNYPVPLTKGSEPRVCWADIETKDDDPEAQLKDSVVRSISVVDQNNEWFICEDTETATINKFIATIWDYDVVCFWNGDEFDVPVLKFRAREKRIPVEWSRWRFFDTGYFYSRANASERWSLDYVAQKVLKKKKVVRTELIEEMFHKNREKLKEYNVHDSKLLRDIDIALQIFQTRKEMADIAGIFVDELLPSTFVDSIIIRESSKRQNRIVFGSRRRKQDLTPEESEKFIGAAVMKPIPGHFKNVIELDFNALYTSIIRSLNISSETIGHGTIEGIGYISLTCNQTKENQNPAADIVIFLSEFDNILCSRDVDPNEIRIFVRAKDYKDVLDKISDFVKTLPFKVTMKTSEPSFFSATEYGLFPDVLDKLIAKRNEYKKLAQEAEKKEGKESLTYVKYNTIQGVYKIAGNSFYGSMGSKFGRYYTRPLGESVSVFGQYLAMRAKETIEKSGYQVLYIDTDGLFIRGPENVSKEELEKIANSLVEKINEMTDKILEEHGVPKEWRKVSIKLELLIRDIVWFDAKKRYAYETFDRPDHIESVGIETKRSDWSQLSKDVLFETIRKLFKGEAHTNIIDYLLKIRDELINGKHNEKLVITKSVKRNLAAYQKEDLHVKAARLLSPRERLLSSRINFVINGMNRKEPTVLPVTNGLPEISQDALKFYYWNRQIFPPTERLIKVIGIPNTEQYLFEEPKFARGRVLAENQSNLGQWK